MKINADLHAILRGTLSQSDGSCHVVIAAAVTVAVLIIGIVPDAQADIIHTGLRVWNDPYDENGTGLRQCHEHILFFPIKVIIFYAAVLQSKYRGSVHAPIEIIGNVRNCFYVNARLFRTVR